MMGVLVRMPLLWVSEGLMDKAQKGSLDFFLQLNKGERSDTQSRRLMSSNYLSDLTETPPDILFPNAQSRTVIGDVSRA